MRSGVCSWITVSHSGLIGPVITPPKAPAANTIASGGVATSAA
jgi:hypothetical protein